MLCSERMLQGEDEITEVNVPEVKVGMVNMLPEINLAQTDTVDIRNIRCNTEWNNRFNIVGMSSEGAIMTVVLRCEGDERTQNSVLVSLSGKNLGAIAINGTNGEWIEATVEIVVYKNNGKELNLFFPREGIEIKEIRITNK